MEELHFSIVIDAPKEKVWDVMLADETYREWTDIFSPGSHYVGDWSEGSKILFLGPNEKGEVHGMVSRIKENRLHDFISIEHLGMVNAGVEDTTSEAVQNWAGAYENYTFKDIDGKTELVVDLTGSQELKEMFEDIWPKALEKLKAIAER